MIFDHIENQNFSTFQTERTADRVTETQTARKWSHSADEYAIVVELASERSQPCSQPAS